MYKTKAWNYRKMMNKKILISYPIWLCKWLTCSLMRSNFGFHYSKDLANNPLAKPQFNLSKWLLQNNGCDAHFDVDSDWIRTILLFEIHAFSEISQNDFWNRISMLAAGTPSCHHFYCLNVRLGVFFLIFRSIVLNRSGGENWIVQWLCSWNNVCLLLSM